MHKSDKRTVWVLIEVSPYREGRRLYFIHFVCTSLARRARWPPVDAYSSGVGNAEIRHRSPVSESTSNSISDYGFDRQVILEVDLA